MKKFNFLYTIAIVLLILYIFRNWLLNPLIIGGDWPYYYKDFLKSFSIVPTFWQPWLGNGLGGVQPLLGLHIFGSSIVVLFHQWLQIPWIIVYKIGWFGLFIGLSVYGSKKLWEAVTQDSRIKTQDLREMFPWWIVASFVYTTNTYILMVTGGGQMGVAIAYGLAPLVLSSFIRLTNASSELAVNVKCQMLNVKYAAVTGLLLGVQLMIDPRIAYVTMVGASLLVVSSLVSYFVNRKDRFFQVLFSTFLGLGFSAGIAVLLNAFWIVPMILMRSNPIGDLGAAYTSIDSIKFYSFADFSHAFSFLHPNWPENVFGKTYFLRPEFLVLPILAFSSLLFSVIRRSSKQEVVSSKEESMKNYSNYHLPTTIYFLSFLALVGAFLVKGAQEPFGSVYQWMFTHVPGFAMFRDPTKWYVLIAISYSVLIPSAIEQLGTLISNKKLEAGSKRMNILSLATYCLLLTTFFVFWLFTIRPAVLGQLGGTFVPHTVPQEYTELEHFLQAQPNFFRTLWVPRQQRFSYGTLDHVPVEAEPLFSATTAAELKVKLDNPSSMALLEDLGIGYVMIPYDSLGELFLTDRTYDEKKRQEYETVLDGFGWLTKIRSGNLTIYQTPRHKDLFWISTNEAITYRRIRMDQYVVSFTVSTPATFYFSQTYHPGWVLRTGNTRMKSLRSPLGLNSFQIQSPGIYEGIVEFEPQKYVTWGLGISFLTVLAVVLVFLASKERRVLV